MTNDNEGTDSGSTITVPRPKDRASQSDFLRDLSRARRGGSPSSPSNPSPVAEPQTNSLFSPQAPHAPEAMPVLEVTPVAPRASSEAGDPPVVVEAVFVADPPALTVDPPALVAPALLHPTLGPPASQPVTPFPGLFDPVPEPSWPTPTAPPSVPSAPLTPLDAPTLPPAIADLSSPDGLFDLMPVSTWVDTGAPVTQPSTRAADLSSPGGLFDLMPVSTWPDTGAPEAQPSTAAADLAELIESNQWTEAPPRAFPSIPPLAAPVSAPVQLAPVVTTPGEDAPVRDTVPHGSRFLPPMVFPANQPPVVTVASPIVVRCEGLVSSRSAGGRRRPVLTGVDLTVRSGEVVMITGRSGAGKTTLLECLAGLHPIEAGSVTVGGFSVGSASEREIADLRANTLGFVAQEPELLADLTAIENIELPLLLNGWEPAEARTEAEAAASLVRLESPTLRAVELSAGERRRIAIARALVGEPAMLWLDEPDAGIDPFTMAEIYELIFELCHEGLAVVVVTHDPVMFAKATTRYELRDGSLRFIGA